MASVFGQNKKIEFINNYKIIERVSNLVCKYTHFASQKWF